MKRSLFLAAATLPLTNLALAQDTATTLEPVIVTATRTPEPESQTLAPVTVIDREEIERRQATSVPDLLRSVPGVAIAQTGGAGSAASIFLRGTNADHVLVLIDGIKIGSATLGISSLQDLPIEQIERIEVVPGPRSSLYGSEAIGGVIQIFTRRGGGPLSPRIAIGGGTLGTSSVSAGLSGGGEHAWFDIGANLDRTDGINACDGRPLPFAGCGVDQNDRDGYRNVGLKLRAGYEFSPAAKVDLTMLRSENRNEFDGSMYAGNRSRSEQQVLGAKATLKPLEPWTLTISGGQSWDKYRAYYDDDTLGMDDVFVDGFETRRDSLSLQNDLRVAAGQLVTLGVDYQKDHIDSTVDYTQDSRDNTGVFGEYQGQFGKADLQLSLRQDDNQQFGKHGTGNISAGYRLAESLRLSVSYGTAFKAPTFNDLYYPYFGNPDLRPEQSHSLEFGLGGDVPLGGDASATWGLSLYQTDIDDLIAYDSTVMAVANVRSARIRGVEAKAAARIAGWNIAANATLLDPENRSDGLYDGNLLPRRPEQTFKLDIDRAFDRWSAGASLFVAGRRFDDLANQVRLDAYSLVGLRAEYAVRPDLKLQARVENLFDEDYETAYLYNQPGRSFYLTLRYAPIL